MKKLAGEATEMLFRRDTPTGRDPSDHSSLDDRVWLHHSVVDDIIKYPSVEKRLAIVTQQLAAMGRTTIVKGCSDAKNRGWRRTPLGGHSGMHYYLWWAPQGSPPAKGVGGLSPGTILVRSVRHHDNHKVLNAGNSEHYMPLTANEIDGDEESIFDSPLTAGQRKFMADDHHVRVVHGYPGSGKTMALWKALESRRGRALYLSWSSALTDAARSRFEFFAPAGLEVDTREFRVFVGSLCGADVKKSSLAESRQEFKEAYDWWRIRDHLGPWKNDLNALHAELRAVLFGRAVPGLVSCSRDGKRLSDEAYLETNSVGEDAARALLETIKRARWRTWYERVFPEIAAAGSAFARIRSEGLTGIAHPYDRVVVDEVQDLSLLESALVVEYCCTLAATRDYAPWLLMAFDDGQTVRPSGFDTGRISDLVSRSLRPFKAFPLDRNVRSPTPISEVVGRASKLYASIDKDWRPKDQQSRHVEQDIAARLIHVSISRPEKACSLMDALSDVDDLAVISPTDTIPEWIPAAHRIMVHTPETVKGLEYASVAVIGVGSLLSKFGRSGDTIDPLGIQARRTAIDGLRVAVSRSTENLIFLDVAPTDDEKRLSKDLLGDPETFTVEDLTEFFQDLDQPLDQRVLVRCRDAFALVDSSPERAWERARQALRLAGTTVSGTLQSDEALRREVCTSVLTVATRRLVDSDLDSRTRKDVETTARKVSSGWGTAKHRKAFGSFNYWVQGRAKNPFRLINSALSLELQDREWLQSSLPAILQSILRSLHQCAVEESLARRFSGDVETWLDLIGYTGDRTAEAEKLREKAVQTLVNAKQWKYADKVLASSKSENYEITGTIKEQLRQYTGAAEAFELAHKPERALRNWRNAGRIDRAVRLAKGQEKTDLEWLTRMKELVAQRPAQVRDRLTNSEKRRLNQLLNGAKIPETRKRTPKPPGQPTLFDDPHVGQ